MFAIDDATAVGVMPTPEAAGTPGFWTEGNPALGQAATLMRASFFNGLQQELLNILAAANITPSKTTYNQLLAAILKIGGGSSRVRGLLGNNNVGTPNTQFDFSAAAVDFRDPTTGLTPSVSNVGTITNNIATAGPAANGRDQAGAFAASGWLHFYFIFNPTTATVATISSVNAPPTGPTLPTGYTAWAYIGAVYLNASSQLVAGRFRGSWYSYDAPVAVLSSGGATVLTSVSVATAAPPNALQFEIFSPNLALTSNGTGGYSLTCTIAVTGSFVALQFGMQGGGAAGTVTGVAGTAKRLPNIGQNFAYALTVTTGAGAIVSFNLTGYSVPNGGE